MADSICVGQVSRARVGNPSGPLLENSDDPFGESWPLEASSGDSTNPDARSDQPTVQMLVNLQSLTQKIIAEATPAVVAIGETGSGVIVSPDGIVLTASHVTRVANRKVSVSMSNGRVVEGITLGSNIASDTGAIRLLAPGPYPFVQVKNSKEAKQGSWCIAMGYPLAFPRGTPAAGRLGRMTKRDANGKIITDCTIMGGDSGGPLLNLEGKVIAIGSSVKLDIGQNLFVPSEQFIKDWKSIAMSIDKTSLATTAAPVESTDPPNRSPRNEFRIIKRTPRKAYLGINAETDGGFVRVRAVHRQSPAQFAGIQANDVVVEMDGISVVSFAELIKRLKAKEPGQQIEILFNRYGNLIKTTVTLGGTQAK